MGELLRRLEPFGVELDGDVRELTADGLTEMRAGYDREGLILLRVGTLTMDEQLAIVGLFGPTLPGSRENYLVSNTHPEGFLGNQELLFHHDIPFVSAPYLGGSLHALDVDDGVAGTRFASGYLAFDSLPDDVRARVDGRCALHLRRRIDGRRTRLPDTQAGDPAAVHAVVRQHPVTGRPYLFVDEDMTDRITGLPDDESEALLAELFARTYVPENIYEHTWRQGDLVIWDNLAIAHARRAVSGGNRTLQRVTMAHWGLYDQVPSDVASFDKLRTAAQPA